MFEFIRSHQRFMQLLLLLLIIPSFVLVSGYDFQSREADTTVAKVGKQAITALEWENAQREQLNQLRQRFQGQFDSKFFETPEAKQRVLDGLIEEKVMAATVEKKHLMINDAVIQRQLLEIPELKGPDGKFSKEQYKNLLSLQGLTPAGFEANMRRSLQNQQLSQLLQGSAFTPKSVVARINDINEQEREVQELLFQAQDFKDKAQVSDAAVKEYYQKNSKRFELPDEIKAEYLILNNAVVTSMVTVSDAEVKAFYDKNAKERYTQQEQRRASHILLELKKGASSADKEKAKAKAEAVLAQVRKTPADFAKLAKENSDDKGSAERGGDLDFFPTGAMVQAFNDAAFKMKKGDISDLVLSEFGYHIISLTDIKPATVKPFDEVKAEILDEIKKPLIAKKMSDLAGQFSDLVEDNSANLQVPADKLKLKVETASGLTRQPNPSLAPEVPYNHVKFLAALFAEDSIKSKRNTQAIELSAGVWIAGRVLEYKPVAMRPFEQVQGGIRENLVRTESEKLAAAAGSAKLAGLKVNMDATGFAAAKPVSRNKPEGIQAAALASVMKAEVDKLPAVVGVPLPGIGYAVYRINKVGPPAQPDLARRQQEAQQVGGQLAMIEMRSYIDLLKEKAKVKIVKRDAAASASASAASDSSK